MDQKKAKRDLILVTGMSGAGRSTALKILEDIGYATIDNLPPFLFPTFLEGIVSQNISLPLVVGCEIQSFQNGSEEMIGMIFEMRKTISIKILFLDCQDDVLFKRYNVLRHRHPFRTESLVKSIQEERSLTPLIVRYADHIIDTSYMTYVKLMHLLRNIFSYQGSCSLEIRFVSFSYRRGLPPEADIVFDARFLENPFYQESLRPLNGQDNSVAAFLSRDPSWKTVYSSIQEMLIPSISGFKKSGRSYLTIAIGCTGGQHRSVFMVEQLALFLEKQGEKVLKEHREISRLS